MTPNLLLHPMHVSRRFPLPPCPPPPPPRRLLHTHVQLDPGTVSRYQAAVATISAVEAQGAAQALPAARTRLAAARQRLKLQVCVEGCVW